jgi:hypothetical protein
MEKSTSDYRTGLKSRTTCHLITIHGKLLPLQLGGLASVYWGAATTGSINTNHYPAKIIDKLLE